MLRGVEKRAAARLALIAMACGSLECICPLIQTWPLTRIVQPGIEASFKQRTQWRIERDFAGKSYRQGVAAINWVIYPREFASEGRFFTLGLTFKHNVPLEGVNQREDAIRHDRKTPAVGQCIDAGLSPQNLWSPVIGGEYTLLTVMRLTRNVVGVD